MIAPKMMKYVDAASWAAQYDEIWRREIYRLPQPDSVRRVLDCGANIGTSATYFSTKFKNAEVTAFEADPDVFGVLQENVETWDASKVTTVNSAVWTGESDRLRFAAEGADSGAVLDSDQGSDHKVIEVSAVALSDYLDVPVDLLKMDIEGAELPVLLSCENRLSNVKHLFVEYHSFVGREQMLGELLDLLKRAGFRLHLDTPSVAPRPFVEVEPFNGMDQYLNIYASR